VSKVQIKSSDFCDYASNTAKNFADLFKMNAGRSLGASGSCAWTDRAHVSALAAGGHHTGIPAFCEKSNRSLRERGWRPASKRCGRAVQIAAESAG
jgi:hypothetical protein